MEVLIPSLVYTILYYFIAIVVWRDGSWSKKALNHDPIALFMMILSFILGTLSLIGVFVRLCHVINN